jgi:hypothetical protein
MKYKKGERNDALLARIERAFSAYRQENPNSLNIYPDNLKMMARVAFEEGLKSGKIAGAAQIPVQLIYNWRRITRAMLTKPSELTIVSARPMPVIKTSAPVMDLRQVRITLGQGICLELPASELSTDLLERLCKLGARA